MALDGTEVEAIVVLETIRIEVVRVLCLILLLFRYRSIVGKKNGRRLRESYSILSKIPDQIKNLEALIDAKDQDCIDILRLGRNAFGKLCRILQHRGGLSSCRGCSVPEQIAIFLSIIAHHQKIRVVRKSFNRSGRTISIHFKNVLNSIIRVHDLFVARADPVEANDKDERWKWFKGCLGALDGTYIPVLVPDVDKARYRTRKGTISVNLLAVCNREMNFVYVLSGWEGSAADGRVLRDAIYRPNGFMVPRGNYYLCDAGYTNGEGFLAPYRGTRYHLKEWGAGNAKPRNAKELFNLRHAKARNCIERCFGILKKRWAILRSQSFYPIETQNKIIIACCLLHNFIRSEMVTDPVEALVPEEPENEGDDGTDYINHIESSAQWTAWRENLANTMFNDWRGGH